MADPAAALASAMIFMTKSDAPGATVTASALSPAGRPFNRTVTGSLNAPLRSTFPLTSVVVPGLISTAGVLSTSSAGRTKFSVTAGIAIVCSPPAIFPLACRAIVIVPNGASSVVLTATVASADLPAIEAAGTASPGGKSSGVICSAASPPLARTTLIGIVPPNP